MIACLLKSLYHEVTVNCIIVCADLILVVTYFVDPSNYDYIPCVLLLLLYLALLLRICLILREGTNIGMDYWTQLTYLWFSHIFGQLHWPHSSAISFVYVPMQV